MLTTSGTTAGAIASTQPPVNTGGADSATFQNAVASEALNVQEMSPPPAIVQRPRATIYQTADVKSESAKDSEAREDSPASDGTSGKTEYTAKAGDTPGSVASAYGQTVEDILLANPELDAAAPLTAGQTVEILDEVRLARWGEIASTSDPDELANLVRQEIQYATSNSATPDDLLDAVVEDILKLRPADSEFAGVVGEQAAWSSQLWKGQGRTHEVMDPLLALSARGDAAGLENAVQDIMRSVAATTPDVAAIEGQRDVLLRYGPQNDLFQGAVGDAVNDFLVERPAQAAQSIADAMSQNGPLAAAALLQNLTQAGNVDPLSAALILNASRDTIGSIIPYLNTPAGSSEGGAPTTLDPVGQMVIFGNLSAAADSASRSSAASDTVADMARRINAEGYVLIEPSIEQGNGIVLALEMIKQSDDANTRSLLAYSVLNGITQFKAQIQQTADEFAENGLPASDPVLLWDGILDEPEAVFEAVLESTQPDGQTLEQAITEDVAQIGAQGYQLMRMLIAINDSAPHLEEFPELLEAAKLPEPDSDPAIELALGSTPALLEALRATNANAIRNGAALDPYAAILDQGWFEGGDGAGRWDTDSASNAPLGVGLALNGLGTQTLGVANEAGGSGWGSDSTDLMYLAQTALDATQAISALLSLQLDLSDMTPEEVGQLPLLQRGLDNISDDALFLHDVYLSYLDTFSIFNIIAPDWQTGGSLTPPAVPSGNETPDETFARQFAPILASNTPRHPLDWASRVIDDYSLSDDIRSFFEVNFQSWAMGATSIVNQSVQGQAYAISRPDTEENSLQQAIERARARRV